MIAASMNLASVDDIVTVNSRFALYPTALPASMIVPPLIPSGLCMSGQVAHSKPTDLYMYNGW